MSNYNKESFENAVKPLIEYLNSGMNPHVKIIVTPTSAELLCGEISFYTEIFLKD